MKKCNPAAYPVKNNEEKLLANFKTITPTMEVMAITIINSTRVTPRSPWGSGVVWARQAAGVGHQPRGQKTP